MDKNNATYELVKMKALPAYELFCELSEVLGEKLIAIVLGENISVHLLVASVGVSNSAKATHVLRKLVDNTCKNVKVNDVLLLQDDMEILLWSKLVDLSIKFQFGDFFLELKREHLKSNQ